MEEFDKIKSLITDNEIKEACHTLRRYAISGRTLNEILMQEAKYYQLERDARNGIISDEHGSKERSKIVHYLLQIVDNVKEESLGKIREPLAEKKLVEDSPNSKSDEMKERKDALYKAGDDCYKDAVYYVGRDKREAHGSCVNASIYYRLIILEYPDKSHGYLSLANTLRVMYLLNYNEYRSEDKITEIMSCVEQGKRLDKDKLYYDAFDLIIVDINAYLRKGKIIRAIYFVCIPIMLLAVFDAIFFEKIFSFRDDLPSTYILAGFMALLAYAFSLSDKQKKHIVGD